MAATIALLPSPFLGPATWAPVVGPLAGRGWAVHVPPRPAVAPRSPADVAAGFLATLPADEDLLLVPHSNAGLSVPALVRTRRVVGTIFVDAVVPPSAGGSWRVAPARLRTAVAPLADAAGLLPPWTRWWDEADVARLFPDPTTRRAVEEEQHRLPLSYLDASVDVPSGWDAMPAAYLAFGDTYADERADAVDRGWPVETLDGLHLHTLIDPVGVARAIHRLLAVLGWSPDVGRVGRSGGP